MSDFTRRPFLASQTDNAVISQPVIFGTEHTNLDGGFDSIDAAVAAAGSSLSFTLDLETESASLTVTTASAVSSLSLQEVVDLINDASVAVGPSATGPVIASAEEGVLAIKSENSGYVASASSHAYIRVLPATTGFADLAPLLGFAAHPHPAATVTAGDLASSSPRAMTQGNRPSSSFVARGEDRTSENFNRALHSLSKNLDNHQVKMVRGVAVPVVLEIPAEVSGGPNPRLDIDATTGEIKGVDLRTGVSSDGLDAVLGTDIFVDLPNNASLADIAKYFAVLDSDWNEILHWDHGAVPPRSRVVGIGTVAYAPAGPTGGRSTFDDDGNSVTPLGSSLTFNSYRTALRTATTLVTHPYKVGDPNDSTGTGAVYETITEIIDGSTIRCSAATFVTSQVEAGDIVVISNSSYSTPINHDGEYIVDVVVSETEIVVRPIDEDNLHLLNDAAGGNLVIRPNGLFENNLYLGFEPRLPRMPAGGIKIVLGMKNEFGEVPRDFLLVPAVNSSEEVDAWVLKNLHQKLNFDGVYQGQGNDKGGGFHATVDGRPITLHMDKSTNSRSVVRSGSTSADEILAGNLLQVQSGDEFTLADVGRSIDLTIGTDEYADWRVHRLLDARTVELVPPPHQIDVDLLLAAGSSVVAAWTLYDNFLPDFQAAISSVTESALAGGFHHTKVNDGTSSSDLSFAHFEHVTDTVTVDTGSAVTGIGTFTATFSGAELSGMSNDPDNLASIFPVTHGSTSLRAANSHGAKTYVRILTTEHAGLYELHSLRPNICVLRNLDGTTPSVGSTSVEASFLNLRMGVGVPVFGALSSGRAGLSVHQDGGTSSAVGIRAGWTGSGSGILVTANEANFTGQLGGYASTGPAIEVISFAPAYGARIEVTGKASASTAAYRGQSGVHVVAGTFAHDLNVGGPTAYRTLGGEWKSAGILSYQAGKDPAGVFMRDQATILGPSSLTDIFPASLVVEDWGPNHSGAGRAASVRGDVFAWDGSSAYFDKSVTGRAVYAYAGEYAEENSDLGSPDVVYESLTLDIVAPDYAEFNFSHDYVAVAGSSVFLDTTRSVNCILKGTNGANLYEGTVIGAKADRLAIRATAGSSTSPSTGGGFTLNGTRWFRSYLNIADYAFLGTGLTLTHQSHRSLLFVGAALHGRTGTTDLDLTASVHPEAIDEALDSGIGKSASRIGAIDPSTAIANLDGTDYSGFNANYRWTANSGHLHWEDSWTDAGLPSGPIEPETQFARDGFGKQTPSTFGSHVTAFNRDFYLLEGDALVPSNRFGGSFQVNRGTSGLLSVAKILGSYVRKDHFSAKIHLRVAAVGSSTDLEVSLGTLSRDGLNTFRKITVGTVNLSGSSAPETIEYHSIELNTYTESNFYNRSSDFHATSMDDQLLVAALEIDDSQTLRVVEFEVQENQRAVYLHGPRVVTASLAAAKFRFTSAVRGYDTRGPQDADFLYGMDYALGGGLPQAAEYARFGGPAAAGPSGQLGHVKTKLKNTPWCYIDKESDLSGVLSDSDSRIIFPNFDPSMMFFKGADSAAVAAGTEAFDPAALVLDFQSRITSETITERQAGVAFPGRTGFQIPVDPPHGSLLSSLLLNMSFQPGSRGTLTDTNPLTQDVYWGVYRDIGGWREGAIPIYSGTPIIFGSLVSSGAREKWEDGAGVKVHLWRYRISRDRPSGAHPDSVMNTHTQEYGYPELIWSRNVYLGDAPTVSDLRVHPSTSDIAVYPGTYGQREWFVTRNFDLTQEAGEVATTPALLIADRRRFSYFVTIEFYIGARVYEADGSISAIPEAGKNEWLNHDHPYYSGIPSVISPTHGTWNDGRGTSPQYHAFRWGQPGILGRQSEIIPRVKFRGLRLGYLSSSPTHGGW